MTQKYVTVKPKAIYQMPNGSEVWTIMECHTERFGGQPGWLVEYLNGPCKGDQAIVSPARFERAKVLGSMVWQLMLIAGLMMMAMTMDYNIAMAGG
jgi:hypothetical protein